VQGRKRYAKEQVSAILREYAQGVPVRVLTARFGVSRSTLRRWRLHAAAAGGWQRTLEHENRLLRRRIGDLSADKTLLQRILRRKTA
jgi:putative transposase